MENRNRFTLFLVIFAILLSLCALCGCRSTKVVTETHTDSTYIYERWIDSLVRTYSEKDSIYIHDSVFIASTGDTVTVEKYHYKDRLLLKHDTIIMRNYVHDSVYINKVDSIPVVVEVEKKLNLWQKVKMNVGGIAMVMLVILGAIVLKKHT